MRPRHVFSLACCCLLTVLAPALRADPATEPILPRLKMAADWQLDNPDAKNPADGWVYGAFYAGLSALEQLPGGKGYHQALLNIGEHNRWAPASRLYHADDVAVTQMYAEVYLQDHDPRMIAAAKARMDAVMAKPSPAQLAFDKKNNPHYLDRWSWCDALFMAPPAWARMAAATGDKTYLDYAIKQWWITTAFLYNPADHLYFRDSTYFAKKESNGKNVYWGRGNGWVMAGIARMLEFMPADHPDRPKFEALLRDMATELKGLQQPDGFWRASLLDPAAYPAREASGTGMICYGMAYGIHHGILDAKTFRPTVDRAWAALVSCQEATGKITQTQPIGGSPEHFDPETSVPYGVGAFLMAGTEMIALAGQ